MLRLESGIVQRVIKQKPGMQLVEVLLTSSGHLGQAISYSAEKYAAGDELLLNTTAVRLSLGTGGYHIVVGKILADGAADLYPSSWGHIMKMRYSPWQMAVDAVEEQNSPYHSLFTDEQASLEGTPVLIGELHSLLPAVAGAIREAAPSWRIVYVMPDGASLPIGLSQQVAHLKSQGLVSSTVTTGHAWGGDWESVNIYNGLLAARLTAKADIIVCLLGPGVAGTGTPLGFSGMQLAEVIHAVSLLGGIPFFIPRVSFSDTRERHRGVSHHTLTLLRKFALRPVLMPVPIWGDERDDRIASQLTEIHKQAGHILLRRAAPSQAQLEKLEGLYDLQLSTMGRSWREDPAPFQAAILAAELAVKSAGAAVSGGRSGFAEPDTLAALALFLTRNGE